MEEGRTERVLRRAFGKCVRWREHKEYMEEEGHECDIRGARRDRGPGGHVKVIRDGRGHVEGAQGGH